MCAARYHTNVIAVSDFIIATRKQGSGQNYINSESDDLSRAQEMLYFYPAEGKLAEACMRFTTRDLTAGSLLRIVSNSYRFHAAVQIIFTCVTII